VSTKREHPRWPTGEPVLIGQLVEHRKFGPSRIIRIGTGWYSDLVALSKRWYQPQRVVEVSDLELIREE